jgi:hypothetical protein
VVIPAKCGHLEIQVPPGQYYIKAVWSFVFSGGIYYVNHFTDAAIVTACCDETACVTLFTPSLHRCGTIVVRALRDALQQKGLKPETARNAEVALNALIAQVPKPARGFELDHLDEIEKLVREQQQAETARPKGSKKKADKG